MADRSVLFDVITNKGFLKKVDWVDVRVKSEQKNEPVLISTFWVNLQTKEDVQ